MASLKVLVVDDENKTRDILVNHIPWVALGVNEIMEADDGCNAMKIALKFKPDLILSDIRMPKISGIELAENLRKDLPDCKYIFISGYSDKEYLKSAIRLNALNYIEKPLDIDEIVGAVKSAVAESIRTKEIRAAYTENLRRDLCLDLADGRQNAVYPGYDYFDCAIFELTRSASYISAILLLHPARNSTVNHLQQLKEEAPKLLDTELRHLEGRYLFAFKTDECLITHFKTSKDFNAAFFIEAMERFINMLKTQYTWLDDVFMGVGNEKKGAENISSSYKEAQSAINMCFFRGNISFYERNNSMPYAFDKSMLKDFADLLRNRGGSDAVLFIRRLGNEIQNKPNTPIEYVKDIFTEILLILVRFSEDNNIMLLKNEYGRDIDCITNSILLTDIVNHIAALAEELFRQITLRNNSNHIVAEAIIYIRENYGFSGLSIGIISNKLHVTPNYLCVLFKKNTDKTINQYITEVRLENAKSYLKKGAMRLNMVAGQVGYKDAKYFSKVFKKHVGICPKEYRERQFEKNNR